jgi:2-phosphosulfolactate phosphatase
MASTITIPLTDDQVVPPAQVTIVIDVIRAFTTAAEVFAAGASQIVCVAEVDAARQLSASGRVDHLMGEVRGIGPADFDHDNSPRLPPKLVDAGSVWGQRTSNGTRGLARSASPTIVAAGATNASATARYVTRLEPTDVVIICTGADPEDWACAAYIEQLLAGHSPDPAELAAAIIAAGQEHIQPWRSPAVQQRVDSFLADVAQCALVDRHPFAMVGTREADSIVLSRSEC